MGGVSKLISQSYKSDTEKNTLTTKLFASLWRKLAHEFIDVNHIDEYDSIKHGFRVRSSGFSLAVGLEYEYGVFPPDSEMKMIGSPEHRSTFFKIEPVGALKEIEV